MQTYHHAKSNKTSTQISSTAWGHSTPDADDIYQETSQQTLQQTRNTRHAKPIIQLEHVSVCYNKTFYALKNINLSIHAGERVCILGANGSGKSTLARVIAGLMAPDQGHVCLLDHCVFAQGAKNLFAYAQAQERLGYVFQNPDEQIINNVVEDDIAFGPENLGVSPHEIEHRVKRELSRFTLDDLRLKNPHQLSGGQKQRLALAGALAMDPYVLILDEPSAQLDVTSRKTLDSLLKQLSCEKTTIIHITHFMDEALEADRVVVLDHGRIVADDAPPQVFSHDKLLRDIGLDLPLSAQISNLCHAYGCPGTVDMTPNDLATLLHTYISTNPQRDARSRGDKHAYKSSNINVQDSNTQTHLKHNSLETQEFAVEAQSLGFSYQQTNKATLSDLTFKVKYGTRVAFIGQTGSGKSTLLRLISGLDKPTQGNVFVNSRSLTLARERRYILGRVGYVMQNPELQLFGQTVYDDVAQGTRNQALCAAEIENRTNEALEAVGMLHKKDAAPDELSRGEQRRCAIAGILAMKPKLILMDEPTSGLDPHSRECINDLLGQLKGSFTLLEATHDMNEAAQCDYVLVLHHGCIVAQGAPSEIFTYENENMLKTWGLGLPDSMIWAKPCLNILGNDEEHLRTTAGFMHTLKALLSTKGAGCKSSRTNTDSSACIQHLTKRACHNA